jgi:hypothetical protein
MPPTFAQLKDIFAKLERHYADMQDIEFTVEKSKLWMLQTRSGKRTAKASLRIAVEMANEGVITKEQAINRIEAGALDQLCIRPSTRKPSARSWRPASPLRRARHPARSCSRLTKPNRRSLRAQSHSRARRNLAGRHSRHARRRRHSHDARRHDLACGGRRARHGQALRFRRGLGPHRLRREDA